MRLATIVEDGRSVVGVLRDERVLPLAAEIPGSASMRAIAASGEAGTARIREWVAAQPDSGYRPIEEVDLGPAVPDPGAIYTVGLNYPAADADDGVGLDRPPRPLIYGKATASVAAHGSVLSWDRSLTANVDPEVELGLVIGQDGDVFGYTIINDISSRDAWLDGDQWLLGKSMPGFCPVGPWVIVADDLEPGHLRLGSTINEVPIQDGRTDQMLYSIDEILAYLRRHVELRPGDLIATGTPARLPGPMGPDRHLQAGDSVTVSIEGIGSLSTAIA
jgi:2-keto-4-pentenoate hydratase/2-oxohepta-3-ene-1,7-dioic acid hydratase in catechol pathway